MAGTEALSDEERKALIKREEDKAWAFAWDWAAWEEIKLPDGPFIKGGREYLWYPMTSNARVLVEMKGTQGGFSTAETLCDIHGCKNGTFPKGVIYCMPTDTDVLTMSKTKFTPLIAMNPGSIGKFVQSGTRGGSDSADLKKIGNSYIYFLSAMLKRGTSGELTSSTLKSRPCDKFVCDEYDEMHPDVLELLRGRYADSDIKQERLIANPTGEGYGVDAMFSESSQMYWHRLCPSCGKFTCPDDEFWGQNPERIFVDGLPNGFCLCRHCFKPIPMFYFDRKTGKMSGYVAKYPGREIEGLHWSHLNSVKSNGYDILKLFRNPPEGNLKGVIRNRLGRAYSDKEDQLKPSDVRECCSQEPMANSHKGPCVMGVDVMKNIHYCIGPRIGTDTYEVVKMGTCGDFKDLYDIAKKYNVKYAGIDVAPDIHAAKEFQKTLKAYGCKAFLVDYRTARAVGNYGLDEEAMVIKANRTEAMDQTHNMVLHKQFVFPRSQQCEEYIKQICAPFKDKIVNNQGLTQFIYRGSKIDHLRHSLNYMVLAGKVGRAPKVSRGTTTERQTTCIN